MKTVALIIMVSIVLEALVEYFKTLVRMIEEGDYKTAITQAVTMVLGVALAFAFHVQLFNGAMSEFYEGLHINGTLDMILTGILFSRGSNYISDLISRLIGDKHDQIYGEGDDEEVEDFDILEGDDFND